MLVGVKSYSPLPLTQPYLKVQVVFRMLWVGLVTLAAVGVGGQEFVASRACYHHPSAGGTIYDFYETDVHEAKNISLADYRGKVNSAVMLVLFWNAD